MNWELAGQATVVAFTLLWLVGALDWFVVGAINAYKRWAETREQEIALELERERVLAHQRQLLAIADAVDAAPERDRLRMMREAEGLGFFDQELTETISMKKAANPRLTS